MLRLLRSRLAGTCAIWLLAVAVTGCSGAVTPPPSSASPSQGTNPAGSSSCDKATENRSFITSVSDDGRYFVDQRGQPILVRGDSPWSGLIDWSPGQAETYFANRDENGYNASIMSLIGTVANGGPFVGGATFDGIEPFIDGDITRWNEKYWQRMDNYLQIACQHGNTVFLYPLDGWTYKDDEFSGASRSQLETYGKMVAARFAQLPNIAWMAGGDYAPDMETTEGSGTDHQFDAVLAGIRNAGDSRPFSIQLYDNSYSSQSVFWRQRIDWNFVYSYFPTYVQMLNAYRQDDVETMPTILGESNYSDEDNLGGTPTTNQTLRRQVCWALTSGGAGEFAGSRDWLFAPGWEERLDLPAVIQARGIRDFFESLRWWELVPDDQDPFVISGRGKPVADTDRVDMLDNDYVTAARTPDGTQAAVYVPTAREITLDMSKLSKAARAVWIDPSAASGPAIPAVISADGKVSTPGANADGDGDWLLSVQVAP